MDKQILSIKSKEELDKHKRNFYEKYLYNRIRIIGKYKFHPQKIPPADFFLANIKKFTSFEGKYYFSGKDPLVETALQLLKNPNLKLNESYLYNFYEEFQPKTCGDLFNLNQENKLHEIESTNFFNPWIHEKPSNIFRSVLAGPKDISDVEHRIIRLKNLIYNIRKYGYKPSQIDIIEGYILIKNNDYRFIITAGHHRVAVLSAFYILGYHNFRELLVRYDYNRISMRIVKYHEVKTWLGVKSGYLSETDALDFFDKFFNHE